MKHKEALMQLSLDDLIKIEDNLKISSFDGAAKSWIVKNITEYYENPNSLQYSISDLGEKTINDLLFYVYTEKPFNEEQIIKLNEYGILVNNVIPSDLRNRLRNWSRNKYVRKNTSFKQEEIHHTLFLKFVLVLLYFKKVREIKITNRKNDINHNKISKDLFMEKQTVKEIVNTLIRLGLVQKTKEKLTFNEAEFNRWSKQPIDVSMEKIYRYNGNKVINLLHKIAEYQDEPNEWVDMSVILNTSLEYDIASQWGLIQVHQDEDKVFVQLMPEGWFLAKKEYHPLWKRKSVLVSAAFEVFVPYYHEPTVLFKLLPVCTLKDSEYFLIFEIDLGKVKKSQKEASNFFGTLVSKSITVPDIVKYELKDLILE